MAVELATAARLVVLLVGFVNLFFTALTLLLIWVLHERNHFNLHKGFQFLVLLMTIEQAVYDVSQTIQLECTEVNCNGARFFAAIWSGFSTAALADIIVIAAVYIVLKQEQINIYTLWRFALVASVGGGGIIASINTAYKVGGPATAAQYGLAYSAYGVLRLMEMVVAAAACGFIFCLLYADKNQKKKSILRTLATRLVFYPISMSISRLGATIWIYKYQSNIPFDSKSLNAMSAEKTALFYVNVLLTPASGFFNFTIFTIVQPFAYDHLRHFASRLLYPLLGEIHPLPLPGHDIHRVSRLHNLEDHKLIQMLKRAGRELSILRTGPGLGATAATAVAGRGATLEEQVQEQEPDAELRLSRRTSWAGVDVTAAGQASGEDGYGEEGKPSTSSTTTTWSLFARRPPSPPPPSPPAPLEAL